MKHVATLVVALMFASTAQAEDMKFQPLRTISVTGFAERKVVPDEAHMTVNLNAMDMKLAHAKADHDKKLRRLMDILGAAGVAEKKVATQSSTTQPVYTYENNPRTHQNERVFKGYRVQTMLDVTVSDTTKLGKLMEEVTNAGFEKNANTEWGNLLSTYYTISNPEQVKEEMLIAAIANAKSKAQQMANAAGAALARVHQITEGGAPVFQPRPVPMMAMAKMADAGMESVAPPAGEQELNSTVTVVYELQ